MREFQSIQDVLNFAISLERISQQFYDDLAGRVDDPGTQYFLLEMSREEALHEEQLRSLVQEDVEELSGEAPPDEVQLYVQAMRVPDELDYKKAVKVAYDKEAASQMLYSLLSQVVESESIQEFLRALAKQEKKHKEFFAKEYNRIRLSEN